MGPVDCVTQCSQTVRLYTTRQHCCPAGLIRGSVQEPGLGYSLCLGYSPCTSCPVTWEQQTHSCTL